jgi:hypothetical protein
MNQSMQQFDELLTLLVSIQQQVHAMPHQEEYQHLIHNHSVVCSSAYNDHGYVRTCIYRRGITKHKLELLEMFKNSIDIT